MNTKKNAARRLEEVIAHAGAPPSGKVVHPLKEDDNMEKAPSNPLPLTDEDIRAALIQLDQATTVQVQAMTT